MLPRFGSSKLVSTWILVTLAASIASALTGGWVGSLAALAPARIWHGEVWRLATWIVIETSPMQLVWTCVAIYKFGGDLAARWGDRRLRRVMLEILLATAAITTLLALATDHLWYVERFGGWAVGDVLVIAWARTFPDRTLVLYQVLQLRGRDVIRITVGVTCLYALYISPLFMLPELLACAGTALYPRSRWRI